MTFKCCHFRQGSSRSPHPRRQGLLLGLTERPPTLFQTCLLVHILLLAAVSDIQPCHRMIPSYAAAAGVHSAHDNHQSLALPRRHIMALQLSKKCPLLKFPARPNQASCSIGAQLESHDAGIVRFSPRAKVTVGSAGLPLSCPTHSL